MLTSEELHDLATKGHINPDVAKEALSQAEKLLADVLEVRKTVEQKATSLFTAYVTIALALFGIGGALVREIGARPLAWPFFVAGFGFVLGAAIFIWALRGLEYGYAGSDPDMWLISGVIDGGDAAVPAMHAYLAMHHKKRTTVSMASNDKKRRALGFGMIVGLLSVVALSGLLAISWAWASSRPL